MQAAHLVQLVKLRGTVLDVRKQGFAAVQLLGKKSAPWKENPGKLHGVAASQQASCVLRNQIVWKEERVFRIGERLLECLLDFIQCAGLLELNQRVKTPVGAVVHSWKVGSATGLCFQELGIVEQVVAAVLPGVCAPLGALRALHQGKHGVRHTGGHRDTSGLVLCALFQRGMQRNNVLVELCDVFFGN